MRILLFDVFLFGTAIVHLLIHALAPLRATQAKACPPTPGRGNFYFRLSFNWSSMPHAIVCRDLPQAQGALFKLAPH